CVVNVERWPALHDLLFVIALSGWVDAGLAGAGAISYLLSHLTDAVELAAYDLADAMDLQQTRPTARFAGDGAREIVWPQITFTAGRAGRDVVVASGPEPSLRWPSIAGEIAAVAQRVRVRDAYTLAGMPALVSHHRAV